MQNMICRCVFVEYGPMELDLNLRVRIDELEHVLADKVDSFKFHVYFSKSS